MARARSGSSSTAYAVATVLFAMLFVISLILAIVFYSRIADAETAARKSDQRLRQFVSPSQEHQPEVLAMRKKADNEDITVFKVLDDEVQDLKAVVNGDANGDIEVIRNQYNELVGGTGRSLMSEVMRLQAELDESRNNNATLTQELTAARDAADKASQSQLEQAAEFEKWTDQIEQSYLDMRSEYAQQQAANASQLSKFEADSGARFDAVQREVSTSRMAADQGAAAIDDLQRQIKRLKGIIADREKAKPKDLVAHDGQVESLLSGEDLVYIDVGRLDHILPGMTFEIFGKKALVRVPAMDDETTPRGKATAEVIDVGEVSSTARVVRVSPMAQIIEGDKIYNLVYDRNWQPVFKVHGLFDLDQTGRATRADRRRVETIIHQWRGRVRDELNYEVDYLVLGAAPVVPEQPPDDDFDRERMERWIKARERRDAYQQLVAKAKALSIPILNQNRFLELTGYYQR